MTDSDTTSPSHRRGVRRLLIVLAALVVGVLVGAGWYQVALQPGAAIVRAVFDANPLVTPPSGFAGDRAAVAPVRRVALPGAAGGHLDLFVPVGVPSGAPMVLWVHGGGFVSSSSATVADYAITLAAEGFVVGSLDYTLAPEAQHPTPVRQASAALGYLRSHAAALGGDAQALTIGGDSAGAQIASETAAAETSATLAAADGIAQPTPSERLRGVVLFCGLYDMRTVAATGFPALRTYLWAYTGHRDWLTAPGIDRMSTTAQATAAYPPTFLSVGDADPFRTQASELATALRTKGVPVSTLFWNGTGDGLGHEYQFDLSKPQARTALSATTAFIRKVAGR
jgi:acetyl esterase/lipase